MPVPVRLLLLLSVLACPVPPPLCAPYKCGRPVCSPTVPSYSKSEHPDSQPAETTTVHQRSAKVELLPADSFAHHPRKAEAPDPILALQHPIPCPDRPTVVPVLPSPTPDLPPSAHPQQTLAHHTLSTSSPSPPALADQTCKLHSPSRSYPFRTGDRSSIPSNLPPLRSQALSCSSSLLD